MKLATSSSPARPRVLGPRAASFLPAMSSRRQSKASESCATCTSRQPSRSPTHARCGAKLPRPANACPRRRAENDIRSFQLRRLPGPSKWDLGVAEMYDRLKELRMTVFTAEPGLQLNLMVSRSQARPLAVGTTAHGAYGLANFGVPIAKVQALWEFADSPMFSPRERAALSFAPLLAARRARVTPSITPSSDHTFPIQRSAPS